MYRNAPSTLRRFMPAIVKYASNEDGSMRDPFGNPLPAFLIMEKGECLSERERSSIGGVVTIARQIEHNQFERPLEPR